MHVCSRCSSDAHCSNSAGVLSAPLPQTHPRIQPQASPLDFAPASEIVPLEAGGRPPATIVPPPAPLKRRLTYSAASWPATRDESLRSAGSRRHLSPFVPHSPHEEGTSDGCASSKLPSQPDAICCSGTKSHSSATAPMRPLRPQIYRIQHDICRYCVRFILRIAARHDTRRHRRTR